MEFGLGCEYARERKKRGKASRKDIAAQAAVPPSANQRSESSSEENNQRLEENLRLQQDGTEDSWTLDEQNDLASEDIDQMSEGVQSGDGAVIELGETTKIIEHNLLPSHAFIGGSQDNSSGLHVHPFNETPPGYIKLGLEAQLMPASATFTTEIVSMAPFHDITYHLADQSPNSYNNNFRLGTSPLSSFPFAAGAAVSPGWNISMSSPTNYQQLSTLSPRPTKTLSGLRYPVLEPLLPFLGNIIPSTIACDLIDLYFSSSSSANLHPMSPYVLGFIFRKRAFLHQSKPRKCQPALLASMLWVAAQTSDTPILSSAPSARGKICQKLLELTVSLLKPLIHNPAGETLAAPSPSVDGVALGGLGVALPGTVSMEALNGETGACGSTGSLDDVIAYIHLATVVSASEFKGASLRWWNAAWSLARELKLGRELPPNTPRVLREALELGQDGEIEHDTIRSNPNLTTEEDREERRRVWWLVYIVDRHLALCYNRPLFLLDIECHGLSRPMNDTAWQRGDFTSCLTEPSDHDMAGTGGLQHSQQSQLRRGPPFECNGHSIFGYFLPLMTILGEIVDLHHAKNHPRFGTSFRAVEDWDDQVAEISRHLEDYEQSLRSFEQQHFPQYPEEMGEQGHGDGNEQYSNLAGTPSGHSVHTNASSTRLTESDIQTRIVLAYSTHVMHVLHILLEGKWDPVNLIDDDDLWISTESFITATSHAVSAAEAISQILEYDPGLEFMPFFFGIYLLQGSFLLLLIADKLQVEASPSVVKACETIVRAHEACVVTLNTEYQVSLTPFPFDKSFKLTTAD